MAAIRGTRDRGARPAQGAAVERGSVTGTVPVFGPWGRWTPFFGYGYGSVFFDPWGFYGSTRYRFGRFYDPYGYYDPYYGGYYGGYGSYGSYNPGYGREERDDRNMGAIRIKAEPADARVYIDGALVGIVDDFDGLTDHLELEAGTYAIELRADGYETYRGTVEVVRGKTFTERFSLDQIR